MRVIRAPLRVSLFGGGTDRPAYYEKYGSTIISFAITRYMYLIWNPRPTGGCRLSYGEVEELETLKDAKHTLVRAAAEQYGIEEPCTLTIISDVPKGTGLGSSSALAVCLCELVGRGNELAFSAIELEQSVSPEVGFQDYLPATFGGFNVYYWDDGKIPISSVGISGINIVNIYGLLLYTGTSRSANVLLRSWKANESQSQLQLIHELAQDVAQVWQEGLIDLYVFASALNATWHAKRSIEGVTSPELNTQYETAIDAGALGGKLCGAGGGGCWFFLVPLGKRQAVIDATGLREIPFQVAEKGVEVFF